MKSSKVLFACLIFNSLINILLSQNAVPPPQVTVSATADIRVPPDEVYVNCAVIVRTREVVEGNEQCEQKVAQTVAMLKQQGVLPKDLKSGSITVNTVYFYDNNNDDTSLNRRVRYYEISRQINFKLTQLDKFDATIMSLLAAGVNEISSAEFCSSQYKMHRDEARRKACKAAKEKADLLTSELGAKTGKVTQISENYYGGTLYWGRAQVQSNYSQNLTEAAGSSTSAEGALSVGMVTITATVNATFLIE
ncbi:MAG: SIMPL domain-containing protein [Saprospiraceae bacterium]|nr:SIMPL domain-containing protein [Saprospiraceae bacterium]MBP7699021.1 SIMPL domain-containing protein [Saprospiraceae bacterium]